MGSVSETIILVLSANKIGFEISDISLGRLLMCKRRNNGPNIEPCGTPCFVLLATLL
jgi:hypothetical protein